MTAKSKMVYGRLLSLGGKAELIVMGYACLWQNAPVQILVNLSVPTYTTAPLRNNQKYIYREMKLRVDKITRYTRKSDLYTILYQRLTKALQKVPFYHAKGHLYRVKAHLLFSIYESLIHSFSCPFPFYNKRVSLPI